MAEFLTTHGTTAHIEQIIAKARERIVLISPFLRWSRILYERLLEADRRGVATVFVYGKRELDYDQQALLERLHHLSLYFCENLHAKCYFNEQQLIISSLNLYEYSERGNREMGVAFTRNDPVYKEAVAEAHSIIQASRLDAGEAVTLIVPSGLPNPKSAGGRAGLRAAVLGFCIRCGVRIRLNRDAPLCDPCESVWAAYGNPEYTERFCHHCGVEAGTCKAKPLCGQCFWAL